MLAGGALGPQHQCVCRGSAGWGRPWVLAGGTLGPQHQCAYCGSAGWGRPWVPNTSVPAVAPLDEADPGCSQAVRWLSNSSLLALAPLDGADSGYAQADLCTPNTRVPMLVGSWQRQAACIAFPTGLWTDSVVILVWHRRLIKGQWTPNFWTTHSRASLTLWSSTLGHRRAWGKYWEI